MPDPKKPASLFYLSLERNPQWGLAHTLLRQAGHHLPTSDPVQDRALSNLKLHEFITNIAELTGIVN